MRRELRYTPSANEELDRLESDPVMKGVLKQVRKTLGYLETNLRSKSLQTHKHFSLSRRYKREVFEAYAQQHTSSAYRVYWHYRPDETDEKGKHVSVLTIVAILPHS